MNFVLAAFNRARSLGRLGRNTITGSVGLGVRAVIQAVYLIAISRWMGALSYGLFAGSLAFAVLFAPLAGWGVNFLLTQRIANDFSQARSMWARAIVEVVITGVVLIAVVIGASVLSLKERLDLFSMLLIGLGELVVLPAVQSATAACYALDRVSAAATMMCLVPAGRLAFSLAFIALGVTGDPAHAILAYFAGSMTGIVVAFAMLAVLAGSPDWKRSLPTVGSLRRGTGFAIGSFVNASYQEVDKPIMLQMLGPALVGPYTAAFRVVAVLVLPVSALVNAAMPRLFAQTDAKAAGRTMRAIVGAAALYGILAAIAAVCFAPFLPYVFGRDFHDAPGYLLLLAPWPIAFALHQCLAMGLTTSGRQNARTWAEAAAFLLIVVINITLLPKIGAAASVLALLSGEILVAVICATLLLRGKSIAAAHLE